MPFELVAALIVVIALLLAQKLSNSSSWDHIQRVADSIKGSD